MRILMISPYLPWPLYGGGPVRIFNILKELSQRGHQIILLAGHTNNKTLRPDHKLNQFCEKVYLYKLPSWNRFEFILRSIFSSQPYPALKFQNDSLKENLNRLLLNQNFDLIWVNLLILVNTLPYTLIRDIPVVLDQQECEELVYQGYLREGNWKERLPALINLIKIKRFEQKVLPQISAILCVSEKESAFMQSRVPRQVKVWTVPNGVDEEFFRLGSPLENKKNYIILCSNLSVRRNIDAAIWFTKKIFPKIREQIPDAEFWIIGSYPTSEIQQLNLISGVHVTGTVNEIRNYYLKGKVFVAPYRFGAGTKLKVLEAMAMGLPIVATEVGCQGIDVINGQHLLIANTETEFSERVIELLQNPQLAQKLSAAGRTLVAQKYDWKKIVDDLEPKLQKLIYAREK